jgi:hypothetical protein
MKQAHPLFWKLNTPEYYVNFSALMYGCYMTPNLEIILCPAVHACLLSLTFENTLYH